MAPQSVSDGACFASVAWHTQGLGTPDPPETSGLICAVNVSEGQDLDLITELADAAGRCLLDVHRDRHHHRSVVTLGSFDPEVLQQAVRELVARAVAAVDLRRHHGVHPRSGAVDVVPFVPLLGAGGRPAGPDDDLDAALVARQDFAVWAAQSLGLPCFFYGPERTLPDVRRRAFVTIFPDNGLTAPHRSAGWCAVGARPALVAFNVWLHSTDLGAARQIAAELRRPGIRALGFEVGDQVQVSCNLVDPYTIGPPEAMALVETMARARHVEVERAEIVGLAPAALLEHTPPELWASCDLSPQRTVEARLREAQRAGRYRSPA